MKSYFTKEEMECPCCKELVFNQKLFDKMQALRTIYDKPIYINSWYRCKTHNLQIGSKSKNHIEGKAVDIACHEGLDRHRLLDAIFKVGFPRIGIHEWFIHVDIMPYADTIWIYKEEK